MLGFSYQILNLIRNIYIFTLFLLKFQVIYVIQQLYAWINHLSFVQISYGMEG